MSTRHSPISLYMVNVSEVFFNVKSCNNTRPKGHITQGDGYKEKDNLNLDRLQDGGKQNTGKLPVFC